MRRIAIAACATALLIAGCGGGDGDDTSDGLPEADRAEIELITNQFTTALEQKDAARVCDFILPTALEDTFGNKAGCAKQLKRAIASGAFPAQLEIESIVPTDTGANVSFKDADTVPLPYINQNGTWYLDVTGSSNAGTASAPAGSQ